MNELNEQVVAEFRANGGVVREALGGHFKNVHLLLVHYDDRRTGEPNVTPLLYATDGDGTSWWDPTAETRKNRAGSNTSRPCRR
jgi:hypothetical protein